MLRLFQVNEGRYLDVEGELTPNSRVGDVCEELTSMKEGGGVVLMVADGRQMEQSELVAAYAAGMENKPIFVFYQTYLSSPSPPTLVTSLKPRADLERGMSVLSQKPSASLFQKFPPLAKQLSEYSSGLYNTFLSVNEECSLQIAGWRAVLRNCKRIISVYQKHQQHFSQVVTIFQSSRPHYINLVQSFPEQVKLLQQLPVPSSPSPSPSPSPSTSLYDWISTHDEKNSLVDLCSECEKALAQAEDRQLSSSLTSSQQLLESCKLDGLEIQEEGEGEGGSEEKATELCQLQFRMMENIHSTSQRAMRSGDGGTIADLSVSHHKSLQLMRQQSRQLEDIVRTAETRKAKITHHIHEGLRVVTELQMKINESNSVLVFLHETLKLARKRFEVLEQVCTCGEVLGHVVSEIERRQTFNQLFTERVVEVSEELRAAREEEKQRRHTFTSSHRHHFLLSLFPQLTHRLPDATCRLSKISDSTDTTDLSLIKKSLPPHFLPPNSNEYFSIPFSHSQFITTSTPHTSTHPQSSPTPLDTTHRTDKSQLEVEQEPNNERLRWEEEKKQLTSRVQQLQEQLTAVSTERDALGRERERQVLNELEKGAVVLEEDREVSKRLQKLEEELNTLTTEREHLLKEIETCRQDWERERQDLTKSLQVSEATQQQLEANMESVRQEKIKCEEQLQAILMDVAEREEKWDTERENFVARVEELSQAVENEKQEATLQIKDLQTTCEGLSRQLEVSECTVTEQKSILTTQTTEIESANEERSKLREDCEQLKSTLEKKETIISDLEQREMQWSEESEQMRGRVETLEREKELLNQRMQALNNHCQRLSSENEQLRSGSLPDYCRSPSSDGSRSERVLLQQQSSDLKSYSSELELKIEQLKLDNQQLKQQLAQMEEENRRLNNRCESLSSENEQLRSGSLPDYDRSPNGDVSKSEREQLQRPSPDLQPQMAQLKSHISELESENEQLKSENEVLKRQLSQLEVENQELDSKTRELRKKSEQVESQTRELERQHDKLQLEREKEKVTFTAEIERLNSINKKQELQLQEQQAKADELNLQLQEQHMQHQTEVEDMMTKSTELEVDIVQLKAQNKTVTDYSEQLKLKLKEAEGKQVTCLECEKKLITISTMTKNLEEREGELKRSESRHQQAQNACTHMKKQQEQLTLRIEVLERERTEETTLSRTGEDAGRGLQDVVREKNSGVEKEGGVGVDVSGGWVLEGGGEEGKEGTPQEEVKRLRTELAVERKNRSLLAEELQQVGKERDEFMQKFMEVERELRSHRHSMLESVMTTSSSSSGGASTKGLSASVTASGHQRRLNLTISNLQVDDVALFFVDSYDNYLALCVDGKTYYLNQSCVTKFTDTWQDKVKPPFKRKLLIGRVTKRLHVEVRKEENRLHVPVGTRLYKLEAVELSPDFS